MSYKTHDTISSASFRKPVDALMDSVRKAINKHAKDRQVLHIVFVSLILFEKDWHAVVSVTAVNDIDGDGNPAILIGHLPHTYAEYYDELLSSFDHLHVIENENLWQDIRKYFLDAHFYQAVHFGEIEKMNEAEDGGGFLRSRKEANKIEGNFEPNITPDPEAVLESELTFNKTLSLEHRNFELAVQGAEAKLTLENDGTMMRNQREGHKLKNLIFDLKRY